MKSARKHFALLAAVPLVTGALWAGTAGAQQTDQRRTPAGTTDQTGARSGEVADARELVQNATRVVEQMKVDPQMKKLMNEAQGIFIVPNFVRGALIIGGRGGEGVMLARQKGGQWSGPAFYNVGGVSFGLQAGGETGSIAFLLMNDKAVNSFKRANEFSLNAEAGFNIVDYAAGAGVSTGQGRDVIAWSDTAGLFAGAAVGVGNINWDEEATRAYYSPDTVTPDAILSGKVKSPKGAAQGTALHEALKK